MLKPENVCQQGANTTTQESMPAGSQIVQPKKLIIREPMVPPRIHRQEEGCHLPYELRMAPIPLLGDNRMDTTYHKW